jgi:hypothetical protein
MTSSRTPYSSGETLTPTITEQKRSKEIRRDTLYVMFFGCCQTILWVTVLEIYNHRESVLVRCASHLVRQAIS